MFYVLIVNYFRLLVFTSIPFPRQVQTSTRTSCQKRSHQSLVSMRLTSRAPRPCPPSSASLTSSPGTSSEAETTSRWSPMANSISDSVSIPRLCGRTSACRTTIRGSTTCGKSSVPWFPPQLQLRVVKMLLQLSLILVEETIITVEEEEMETILSLWRRCSLPSTFQKITHR